MTFKAYWNTVKRLIGTTDLVLHLRISTNKIINEEQTHPFRLGFLQELEGITTDPVFFMNGSISNQFLYDNMNDTQSYIKDYQQAFEVINKDVLNLIQHDTCSKWCVVTPDDILLSDGFVKSDGKFYSNLNHKQQGYITYNPDLIGKEIVCLADLLGDELVSEIVKETDLYNDLLHYVRVRCQYQDVCEWCLGHCLNNLETIDEVKKFYNNYVDENGSGDIQW